MRYKTLLSDPPWNESGGGKIKRGADRHYPLMKTRDICAMGEPLQQYLDDDMYCFMWVTNNFLLDGAQVLQAWGFRYVTLRTWAKPDAGIGQYMRGQTEQMIFGVRGKPGYPICPDTGKRRQLSTLIGKTILSRVGKGRGKHSRKPPIAREEIDWFSGHCGPTLELFCRDRFISPYGNTWHIWGNELEDDIELHVPNTQLTLTI